MAAPRKRKISFLIVVICTVLTQEHSLAQENGQSLQRRPDDHPATDASFPFPQNLLYPFGLMPTNRNHRDALESYITWKNTYVTSSGACGFRRVLFNDMLTTYSEGIGYGMLLAATFNDQALFDDLWNYYRVHRDIHGLMNWWIGSSCGQVIDGTGATDADEDAAFALVLANMQWGNTGTIAYLDDAVTLINAIYQFEVEDSTHVLKPGDAWGGAAITNPSYFAPAYYRTFADITGNVGWYAVINSCYDILNNAADRGTGLVPDWCRADGLPAQRAYYYYYDATRTPWRIALDYLWNGEQRARAFCEKISSFARGIGSVNIVEGYYLNGTPIRGGHNNVFVGPFGVGGMAGGPSFQAFVDSAYADNVATVLPAGGGYYYNWSLKTLTLLVQTGNFLSPPFHLTPVQLVYFRGQSNQSRGEVLLEWGTLSEVNNYGFEVQRRPVNATEFATLPNSFVPGHGTTIIPQQYRFTDRPAPSGSLFYRLKQMDLDGRVHFTDPIRVEVLTDVSSSTSPAKFSLMQNYPNPFNPSTVIPYEIARPAVVTIAIYNTLGQEIAEVVHEEKPAGRYAAVLHADGWASGMYICRMRAGDFVAQNKLILLR